MAVSAPLEVGPMRLGDIAAVLEIERLSFSSPWPAFAFEQEKIGDEVWMPSSMEANVSARVLLLARFNRSVERRYSEYKRYQIDSKYDLTKPKENAKP